MQKKPDYLYVGIQKSGRLKTDSCQFIASQFQLDYSLENCNTLLYSDNKNKIEYVFLREKDIPQLVRENVLDMGIVGMNTYMEDEKAGYNFQPLGFSECRLMLAVPEDDAYRSIDDLDGKTIATSYPVILERYLKTQGVEATIRKMSGSVEAAPSMGYADAICDLVETGNTLRQNKLRTLETIFESQAIAIFSPEFIDITMDDIQLDTLRNIKQNFLTPAAETEPLYLNRLSRTY